MENSHSRTPLMIAPSKTTCPPLNSNKCNFFISLTSLSLLFQTGSLMSCLGNMHLVL
nr:MAG TPA: hypothetical protein [Caudoviricetes sp.]